MTGRMPRLIATVVIILGAAVGNGDETESPRKAI